MDITNAQAFSLMVITAMYTIALMYTWKLKQVEWAHQEDVDKGKLFALCALLRRSVHIRKSKRMRRVRAHARSSHWAKYWAGISDDQLLELPHKAAWEEFHGLPVEAFIILHSILEPYLRRKPPIWGKNITTRTRLLMTLRFLRGESMFGLQQMYDVGKSTAYVIVQDVCEIIRRELAPLVIRFPRSAEQCLGAMRGFYQPQGIPNVIGCIDGTHIYIRKPPHNVTNDYIDRTGRNSLTFQCCVDHMMNFTNVYGPLPGSFHDSRIFNMSAVRRELEAGTMVPAWLNAVLLGDAGYPLATYIMTPFPLSTSASNNNFNYKLSSTRMVVERVFGGCKGKWGVLQGVFKMHDVAVIGDIVHACCALWNFYNLHKNGVLTAWLSGNPTWGEFDLDHVQFICRDLDTEAEALPREAGEAGAEKRMRKALAEAVSPGM